MTRFKTVGGEISDYAPSPPIKILQNFDPGDAATFAALLNARLGSIDEVIATASAACSTITVTTRFDLATAANNVAATLADGTIGQRKTLINMSASSGKATTITPTHMAEGYTAVTLTAALDSAVLEFQASGWKVVALTGSASVS